MKGARRLLAVVLLALLQWPVVSVFAASDPDANLPACCRRLGRHKCELMHHHESKGGPSFQAAPCPMFPGAIAAPSKSVSVLLTTAPIQFVIGFVAEILVTPQAEVSCSASFRESDTRGPPTA